MISRVPRIVDSYLARRPRHCYYPRDATVADNGADTSSPSRWSWRSATSSRHTAAAPRSLPAPPARQASSANCRRLAPAAGHRIAARHPVASRHPPRPPLHARPRVTARPILLVPGVHASGIDEPRLVGFARELRAMGHPVVTAELSRSRPLPRHGRARTDMIEDAALVAAPAADSAADGRIGMMGISFAGGLSIVAAGRPALRDRVAFVLSFGGHGDLPRTLQVPRDRHRSPTARVGRRTTTASRSSCSASPTASCRPIRRQPLRSAILSFLEASRLDMVDKAQAAREFARARTLADALAEPSRTLMTYVNNRDVAHLGPILAPAPAALRRRPGALARSQRAAACPVYLLHGTDDNVIPAIESALLARTLRERGVDVHFLATPLVTHAEVDHAARRRRLGARALLERGAGRVVCQARRRGARARGDGRLACIDRRSAGRELSLILRFSAATSSGVSSRKSPGRSRVVGDRPDRARGAAAPPGGRSPRTSSAPGGCALRESRSTGAFRALPSASRARLVTLTSAGAVRRPSMMTPRARRSSSWSSGTPSTRTWYSRRRRGSDA